MKIATALLGLGLACASAPAFAAHPIKAPILYRVEPGSVVFACGGFVYRCELWQLGGTIEVGSEYIGHNGEYIPPGIVDAHLEVVAPGGHPSPFPQAGDLPLTALEGRMEGDRLVLESPRDSAQLALLTMIPFQDGPNGSSGLVLTGLYDEGCCDRFHIELGNIVLRPEHGVAALDLHGHRFHVLVSWRASGGRAGEGHPVALDQSSGYFWFFSPDNPEVFVKVLDACAVNGRFWLFAGGLTNLGVEISFQDDFSDYMIPVTNPLGQNFATYTNSSGFPCAVPANP